MSKKAIWPPIPHARLEEMHSALISHILAGEVSNCEPLSIGMAIEIEEVIKLLIRGPKRPSRASKKNLRAAAVVRDMIRFFKITQEEAVAVVFPNPNQVDVSSLTKTYRNLLPRLAETEWSLAAAPNEVLAAYYQTEHFRTRKLKRK